MHNTDFFTQLILDAGAQRAAMLPVEQICFDLSFRSLCEQNSCGLYGKCHMCPPDVGEADALVARAQTYSAGILYQNVYPLEDSFDFEGMMDARHDHSRCAQAIHDRLLALKTDGLLHLAAGGCGVCQRCTKLDDQPCRLPERALPSLEAYCVDVSQTAANAGLKYVNGPNTVTYFGLLLIGENAHA